LKKDGKYKFLCSYEFKFPWPISGRDMISYGSGVDMLEEDQSVLVVIKTPDLENFKLNEDNVHIMCNYAGIYIKYISENETKIILIANVDPKLDYVPNWIINYLLPSSGYYTLKHIQNVTEKLDGEHRKRIENDEIYQDIARRLKNFELKK
jgi:hypothetical protein